eukprot:403343561
MEQLLPSKISAIKTLFPDFFTLLGATGARFAQQLFRVHCSRTLRKVDDGDAQEKDKIASDSDMKLIHNVTLYIDALFLVCYDMNVAMLLCHYSQANEKERNDIELYLKFLNKRVTQFIEQFPIIHHEHLQLDEIQHDQPQALHEGSLHDTLNFLLNFDSQINTAAVVDPKTLATLSKTILSFARFVDKIMERVKDLHKTKPHLRKYCKESIFILEPFGNIAWQQYFWVQVRIHPDDADLLMSQQEHQAGTLDLRGYGSNSSNELSKEIQLKDFGFEIFHYDDPALKSASLLQAKRYELEFSSIFEVGNQEDRD